MAYHIDYPDGDIVIDGFENGIGDSPTTGFYDMKNVNLSSVPKEVSVNFKTASKTPPIITDASVIDATSVTDLFTLASIPTGFEVGLCIKFTALSDITKGVSLNTPYWVHTVNNTFFKLATDYERGSVLHPTGSLTGTFSTYNMGSPRFITKQGNISNNFSLGTLVYFMIDSNGLVWSNKNPTTSGLWTYTGNTPAGDSHGNGLVYYQTSDTATGYLFAFRSAVIDYIKVTNPDTAPTTYHISWTYGWNPNTGTTGQTTGLKSVPGSLNVHDAMVMPDGRVYFTDGSNVGKFYQTNLTGTTFDPTNTASYTYTTYPLLPLNDIAQCIAPSGTNILIGGLGNTIYTWDKTSSVVSYPILIAESNVQKMITINTNTFIFVGNRGRIYVTNGAQASLFKKIPDHLSNTIEPYFIWGGVCSLKNQLYFGVGASNNAGTKIPLYGGVWAIDIDTKALRLANKLSYNSYTGNATALYAQCNPRFIGQSPYPLYNPVGSGLVIGWDNTDYGSANGIDLSSGSIYTGGETEIVSELIPVGTYLNPKTIPQYEFKLATPLLVGEKVELQVASGLASGTNPTFTSVLTTNGDGVLVSGNSQGSSVERQQWTMVKAILTGGTVATPSFNRITELRIIGGTSEQSSQKAFTI